MSDADGAGARAGTGAGAGADASTPGDAPAQEAASHAGHHSHAPAPLRVSRRPWLAAGVIALIAVALVGAAIVYSERQPFGFEIDLMAALGAARTPPVTSLALALDVLGGGALSNVVFPILIVAALLVWRRPWAALYFGIAALASAGVTRLVKALVGRVRPEDILVQPDFGSFPSGHSSAAALIATALGLVFMRTWVWVAGIAWTVLMMLSRMYLGAHWLSDTFGGALVGAGVALVVWAPFAYRLYRENRLPHPPVWRSVDTAAKA
ncbi:phosphatase PAP2 family protein [Agromyces bracchium]|uniref:Phosphatase PAP2 family protein n=1 Tax=Agromyces bracchium TaxID=88376 RepID=A0A6I3MB55_9MICO|nr:phosphatase PAP2 family protein [Agromyces bracchium]MTH69998.1 phosphatase PAP2 family protein [Agromyces bracchium]